MTTLATQPRLYSLSFSEKRTYFLTAGFVLGNILLPQLCHLMPHGGNIFLPIYFFTLLAAYKYGLKAGLMTAVLSPLANSLLFGMPVAAMLPVIMVKSVLLATIAALVAHQYKKTGILAIAAVVVGYLLLGGLFEWAYASSFAAAVQDLTLGLPGIALQVVGVYLLLRYALKK